VPVSDLISEGNVVTGAARVYSWHGIRRSPVQQFEMPAYGRLAVAADLNLRSIRLIQETIAVAPRLMDRFP
jgi:hypothetical protein